MSEEGVDFGMVGLGTMGKALLLNMGEHGFRVAGLDTDPVKAQGVAAMGKEGSIQGFSEARKFVNSIRRPRAIMMLVPAGPPVDSVIGTLRPLLERGDFLIDGGNSYYKDTERRVQSLSDAGFGFMGMGVSGGEEGARHGPSMMPGGEASHYARVQRILEAVAARYENEPCVGLVGRRSAGHYVKTVHNGIEYGLMQLIAEVYDLLRRGFGMELQAIADLFAKWNERKLAGFLVEITVAVLRRKDEDTGTYLVDQISDRARQKGTGKWTSQDAMDLGIPVPTIDAAVGARELSAFKELREKGERLLGSPRTSGSRLDVQDRLEAALSLSMLVSHAQGWPQLKAASDEYGFETDLRTVAGIWRAGCIIRSAFLEPIRAAFERDPELSNLLLDEETARMSKALEPALRQTVLEMVEARIPCPAFAASLAYFDGLASARLPANLIQAERDLFGAHTYERLDRPGSFHTDWGQAR